jgi:hypothetical protein
VDPALPTASCGTANPPPPPPTSRRAPAGVVYDFAGPYAIGIDGMAFSAPTRYLQLDATRIPLAQRRMLTDAAPGPARTRGGAGSTASDAVAAAPSADVTSGGDAGGDADALLATRAWDAAVDDANTVYCRRMHNIW